MNRSLIHLSLVLATVVPNLACGQDSAADDAVQDPVTRKPVILFDGVTLDGWRGRSDLWSIEDGAIVGRTREDQPIEANTFLISDVTVQGDFDLTLQYKIEAGNSGVQYLSQVKDDERFIVGGYQADIDATGRYTGILYEEKGRGILATRGQDVTIQEDGQKKVKTFASADDLAKGINQNGWNDYRIRVAGNVREHYINESLMSRVTDLQSDKSSDSGVVALQLHRGPAMVVRFRNIIVQP